MWRYGFLAALALVPAPVLACRLALALGMDVSASVNTQEYRLQMTGTAAALTSDAVRAEIFRAEPVALALFVWSGLRERWLISEWVVITDGAALERFAGLVANAQRPPFHGRTATGEAMRAGAELIGRAPECARRVLDLATDGRSNDGVPPRKIAVDGFAINALSIGGGGDLWIWATVWAKLRRCRPICRPMLSEGRVRLSNVRDRLAILSGRCGANCCVRCKM